MALFNVVLTLPAAWLQAVLKIQAASERQAVALEGLLAKVSEDEPDQQPAVDALVSKLQASNAALADEVAKILAVNP